MWAALSSSRHSSPSWSQARVHAHATVKERRLSGANHVVGHLHARGHPHSPTKASKSATAARLTGEWFDLRFDITSKCDSVVRHTQRGVHQMIALNGNGEWWTTLRVSSLTRSRAPVRRKFESRIQLFDETRILNWAHRKKTLDVDLGRSALSAQYKYWGLALKVMAEV